MKRASDKVIAGSFRDPSGFLFTRGGALYRQINKTYKEHYDLLMGSGLFNALVGKGLLIPHEEVDIAFAEPETGYKVIKPDVVQFISYPYEWCFSQLKDAALTTLNIQKIAFEHGMILKDASAYNIQFVDGRPVFIDTLSFERYREGEPWVAYRQFCQHFLAPLALMRYTDVRLNLMSRLFIDGIPLDLASAILPKRTRFRFSLFTHIHLHAGSQRRYANRVVNKDDYMVSAVGFTGLIESLESAVKKLKWKTARSVWAEYYEDTNYSDEAMEDKKRIVAQFIDRVKPKVVLDMGANVGLFSRVAGKQGALVISMDNDPVAVELNYREVKKGGEKNILPLVADITNPSPGIGWEGRERSSLIERGGDADMVMALALVHHLAISNNLPFAKIATFLSGIGKMLIIEFIPKDDSQVQRLLATREDIFTDYTQKNFEGEFKKQFNIIENIKISDSKRSIYLMEKRR
ncbi:MAG: SAM-dependent methyltransferase [Candidatus Coatesbacteria bacterium]|nr:MAG: SAM-dependent methyltransferase [Candidatus Coatesbacteria bacterium]